MNAPRLSLTAAAALATFAWLSAVPVLASAQTYEFQMSVMGLRVSGVGTGTGSQPDTQPHAPGSLQTSTSLVDFGSVATHTTEKRQVVLTNTGGSGLGLTAAPAVLGDLAFGTDLTTCGESLAAGQSCLTDVLFAPTTVGAVSGSLRFSTSITGAPADVTLQGTAFNPVSLASTTLPRGMRGKPYSYDFKQLLSVSNEASPDKAQSTWSGSGTLPAGLGLDKTTGVLSGTPSAVNPGTGYTVTGTYKNNQGQQVYIIKVGDAVLEVVQIEAGTNHSCAITTESVAKCWGYNANGQLGDGTGINRETPTLVTGVGSSIASIAVGLGGSHTCAVTTAGGVKCWGWDNYGQLGNDAALTNQPTPVDVAGLTSGVARVAAGAFHTCAVTAAGAVKCWGYNGDGQLGDGTTVNKSAPADVQGLGSGVRSLAIGGSHSCAVTTAGAVKCWGYNGDGQLGDGTTTNKSKPVSVQGFDSGISSITAGGNFSCGLTAEGAAKCWGRNIYGQLGDGTKVSKSTPGAVQGLSSGVMALSAGGSHACAVSTAGAVKCWGYNVYGQLGDGTTTDKLNPVSAQGLQSAVTRVEAGGAFTCAVTANGATQCWGTNNYGQLGDGTKTQRTAPVNVLP